ncbi:hypothetical protein [Neisseria zalophi]|uniref:hypothetical protein n=1 Tax=Neisseria zalophi TaxID=640030 RepID=UPI0012459F14|nr:hypothetical protein [Neisseria zalophi]
MVNQVFANCRHFLYNPLRFQVLCYPKSEHLKIYCKLEFYTKKHAIKHFLCLPPSQAGKDVIKFDLFRQAYRQAVRRIRCKMPAQPSVKPLSDGNEEDGSDFIGLCANGTKPHRYTTPVCPPCILDANRYRYQTIKRLIPFLRQTTLISNIKPSMPYVLYFPSRSDNAPHAVSDGLTNWRLISVEY